MKRTSTFLAAAFMAGALASPLLAQEVTGAAEAQAVIQQQIGAFRSGDHARAFSFAAPNLQRMFGNTDRFIGMVKQGYAPIYGASNVRMGRAKMEGDTLYQEVLLSGPQGKDWSALYSLRQEADGSWRIHGVQMREAQLQST